MVFSLSLPIIMLVKMIHFNNDLYNYDIPYSNNNIDKYVWINMYDHCTVSSLTAV